MGIRRSSHITFFLSIFLTVSIGSAQNVYPDQVDGRVFIKIKDEVNVTLPELPAPSLLSHEKPGDLKELVEIAQRYGVRLLKPTFPGDRHARLSRIYSLEFENVEEVDVLLADMASLPYIEYAEPVPLYRKHVFEPNDRRIFSDLYHLDLIDAAEAWDISQGSEEVVIAIVDDAILLDHEDLKDNIWVNPGEIAGNGVDDDRNGYIDDVNGFDVATGTPNPGGLAQLLTHGTQVAGCAAAATNNGTGVASIGFNCKIMAVKATANPSSANNQVVTNTFEGVKYAVDAGADIVNMSFGGGQRSQTFQELINEGNRKGIVFVASSGNSGNEEEQFPAAYDHVISVAATSETDEKTAFSTYHSTVDVSAPGQSIRTTASNISLDGYTRATGTSFSSPIVAGLLGLMKSVNPCATPEELETILKNSTDNITALNPSFAGKIGSGRINAAKALAAVAAPNLPEADFTFDNSSQCTNQIPFSFLAGPDEDVCASVNSYTWEVTDGAEFQRTAKGSDPQIEFPESGTYEVRLVVSNAAGSSSVVKSVDISINPNAFIEAGKDTVVCLGESIQLVGSTTADITNINWSPAIGLSDSGSLTPDFTARQAGGMYTLTVEGADGCLLTDSVQVDVFRLPIVQVTPADTSILPGDSLVLEVRGGLFYQWSPSQSLSDSTISTPIAFPEETTTYTIKAIGAGRCESEIQYTLPVEGDSLGTPVKREILGATLLDPVPNPAKTHIHLQALLPQAAWVSVSCYALDGRKVETLVRRSLQHSRMDFEWRLPDELPDGVYWIVWEVNGERQSQPFIVAR